MNESPETLLRIGAWCVNPALSQMSRAGETVRVDARTMRLLVHLAARPGEVVSIDELLNHVWSGVIVTPDSVYQAIASLRRQLQDDARQPAYIATVPRLGYRMVAAVGPWVDSAEAPNPASLLPSAEPPRVPDRHRRRLFAVAVASAALAVSVAVFLLWSRHAPDLPHAALATAQQTQPSIGVLPFLDLTEEMDEEYFADGMTEELIDRLSKTPGLHVPARTSSFYFKGKQATIADIAQALGVAYLLEGSVRKSGHMLRVTAQLIRADNGYHVWSDTYDRSLDDVLMVQDDIASEVKKALIASLEEAARPVPAAPASAAYALYFQARTLRRGDRTKTQAQAIVDELRQAIALDPAYAPAWAELARALAYQSSNRLVAAVTIDAAAREAARQALRLDPQLADAHLALGIIHAYLEWDWTNAEREYRNVLALEPASAEVLSLLSDARWSIGHLDDARELMLQAVERDPLDARYHQWLGEMHYALGRLGEAEADLRKALDIGTEGLPTQAVLSEVKLAAGDAVAALELIQREPDKRYRAQGLALVHFALDHKSEADAELAALESDDAKDSAFAIARIHAYRKESDQAFVWLDRALVQRDPDCTHASSDPLLQTLRGDSRFTAFLAKLRIAP
ncbi:MAG: winged helix-turn-helix domain-containing protein [Dokdonella sp.]